MAIIDNPELYFQTKLYTGNSGTNAITFDGSENMQPDWVWLKRRDSGSNNHRLCDSVRGVNKQIYSSSNGAEGTSSGVVQSFDSNGFTLNTSDSSVNVGSYVCWNWKAGTSVSGTSTGSGTGKAYSGSVNTTSGFSIIKYLGNGSSGHTIPHHLSAVPQFIVVKSLDRGTNWITYQAPLGAGKFLRLNQTNAESTSSSRWNDTTPTSTVFTVGNDGDLNNNDEDYIAYIIANVQGYSKIGNYTGNGNADGPFTYLGFKPAFIMIKRTDVAKNWYINDNLRDGYNNDNPYLSPNLTAAGTGGTEIDLLSNGFKITASGTGHNQSGGTYIYMAFAENPFVASNFNAATAR